MKDFTNKNIICISCLAPNVEGVSFCENCNLPIGTTAALDPLKAMQLERSLLDKALTDQPKLIVLVGVWVLHFPCVIAAGVAIFNLIADGTGFSDFVFFCIFLILGFGAIVVLFRVTRNYLTMPNLHQKGHWEKWDRIEINRKDWVK